MSIDAYKPYRSLLYIPGGNERALEKARSLAVDALIFDLEDAVAPENKDEARARVVNAVSQGNYGQRDVMIRINALETEWGRKDLEAVVKSQPNGIVLPKVSTGASVAQIDEALDRMGSDQGLSLWAMIETPLAILNIQEIASKASSTRLEGFILGTNDLAKDQRAISTKDRIAFQTSLTLSLLAARAFGLKAIDGVYNDIADEEGFIEECKQGRILGFDGKTLIHPAQIPTCHEVFSPTKEEITQAHAIIDAFSAPENIGKGVIKVNGKMTELLHLEEAKRIVEIEGRIKAVR